MKPTVYIETTIISYLTAWPNRDLVTAARQQTTREWWNTQRGSFDLLTSELVLIEARAGDPAAVAAREQVLSPLPTLAIAQDALALGAALIAGRAVPSGQSRDALHVGICATNGVTYLMTWNFRHLANATLRDRIEQVCRSEGYNPPLICTPDELVEEAP